MVQTRSCSLICDCSKVLYEKVPKVKLSSGVGSNSAQKAIEPSVKFLKVNPQLVKYLGWFQHKASLFELHKMTVTNNMSFDW